MSEIRRRETFQVVDKTGSVVRVMPSAAAAHEEARRMNDPAEVAGWPFLRPYSVQRIMTITEPLDDPVDRLPTTLYAHIDRWGSAHAHAYRINDEPGRPLYRATVTKWERVS